MPTFTFECHSEEELALLSQAARFVAEMHQLALKTPGGKVLSAIESLALDDGRQLLRDLLQSAAQTRIDHDEKKGAPHAAASAPDRTGSRATMNATS
ncbi:MAG: hypothetical protein ACRELF_17290 [Gemmataceae bacterium]